MFKNLATLIGTGVLLMGLGGLISSGAVSTAGNDVRINKQSVGKTFNGVIVKPLELMMSNAMGKRRNR